MAREKGPQQQRLETLLRERLHPELRGRGFRKSGHTWRRGDRKDPASGWVVLQVQGNRYSTRDAVEFTFNTVAWPAGTWEVRHRAIGQEVTGLPEAEGGAPFYGRPKHVDPERDEDDDWWVLDADTDVEALGDELVDLVLTSALPWAEARLDPSTALAEWREGGSQLTRSFTWRRIYAVAVLRQPGADAGLLREELEELTTMWVADPRPPWLRPHLQQWRQEAGLPVVELPEVVLPVYSWSAEEEEAARRRSPPWVR